MARLVAGLDWSGDSGDPRKVPGKSSLLVLVVALIDEDDLTILEQCLSSARRRRNLPSQFVFHYSDARPSIREAFFRETARVPFTARASVIDKWSWSAAYLRRTSGDDRLRSEIVRLLMSLPETAVAGQKLVIDYPTAEATKVQAIRRDLAVALRTQRRERFRSVKPCPDHRLDGAIIQLADMIAGALHDHPQPQEGLPGWLGSQVDVF